VDLAGEQVADAPARLIVRVLDVVVEAVALEGLSSSPSAAGAWL
jgi:hypothetical protein